MALKSLIAWDLAGWNSALNDSNVLFLHFSVVAGSQPAVPAKSRPPHRHRYSFKSSTSIACHPERERGAGVGWVARSSRHPPTPFPRYARDDIHSLFLQKLHIQAQRLQFADEDVE